MTAPNKPQDPLDEGFQEIFGKYKRVEEPTNDSASTSIEDSGYFPYLSRDEKIDAYKKAITQSLEFAVHPEHLKRVKTKLDALEKFWKADMEKKQ